ncbi:putative acetyltransferase [Tumebacillus sp. BK434]|uniref:GNAT family N-acetyltransferase n=1 Tax=Tumebacillus sp. BK434 TaxID=2512169 RepID=UPI0010E1C2FB|nr:GNAT family N-acetyltransferase [Tumebacillus sp. BK434]TCP58164.1 putative acetyltransferase [Tumebacillus sp. BK434]
MSFELETVKAEQKEALLNMSEFYIYHFSELKDIDLKENGRWDFMPVLDFVDAEAEGRYAYFVRVEGKLAGFVLLDKIEDEGAPAMRIEEFFIMAKYRRNGLGQAVANQVFSQFPGRWVVYEFHKNTSAIAFWRRVISEYTNGNYAETPVDEPNGYVGFIQRFTA